jgi:O-antigen ligase
MDRAFRDRAVDVGLAGVLALFPLLPTGHTYLDVDWPWALEAWLLIVLAAGLLVVFADRRPVARLDGHRASARLAARGYAIWLVPAAAATLLGVLERLPLDFTLWWIEADGLLGRLGRPMHQIADPYYPLRVGLMCLEGALLFWVLSAVLVRTSDPARRVRMALFGCLFGMAAVSLIALDQYMSGTNLHQYWVRANPGLIRAHATLDDPNALASYLVLGIGLASGLVWSAADHRLSSVAVVVTVLMMAALITTVSRAGWAALTIAALIGVALLPDPLVDQSTRVQGLRRVARGAGVLAVAAFLLWAAADLALPDRTTSTRAEGPWEAVVQTIDPRETLETVLKGRQLLWRAGLDLAGTHWLLGAGFGSYPRFLWSYPGSPGPENAHNYFIQVLAEAGTIGFAALVLWLAAMLLAIRSGAGTDRSRMRLSVGVSVGVLAFVLTWLTGHPLLNLSNQLWLAITLAVGLAAIGIGIRIREDGTQPASAPAMTARRRAWLLHPLWIAVIVLLTLAAGVPRLRAIAERDASAHHGAGLYGWEPGPDADGAPSDTRFRWTRARAAVRQPVGGAVLTVPFFIPRPVPVTVQPMIGGIAVDPITFHETGWHSVSYDLVGLFGEERWRSTRSITVQFRVTPTFIPARAGGSTDPRELGIGVGVFSWSGSPDAPAAAR